MILQAIVVFSCVLAGAACGRDVPDGVIEGEPVPAAVLGDREARHASADPGRRILFGDLHVHTTWSIDAFVFSLPIFAGEGARPPADACDFARYCSAIDFFSINDHAEGLTPERWAATKESIRACNARSGEDTSPDLVAFMGWEWTQVGETPESHYGHKNVVLRGLEDADIPARPIASLRPKDFEQAPAQWMLRLAEVAARPFGQEYSDFLWWVGRLNTLPNCPAGIASPELPVDCRENAETPAELFRKLDEWGVESIVIPHGTTWGIHAPPGTTFANQLTETQHDPDRQILLEVMSGHGNGEEYRPYLDRGGDVCPAPTPEHLACCWRAGEIMRERCGDLPTDECERRVEEAKRLALEAGTSPHLVFPDTDPADWLDCDQCRDCFKPAMNTRAGASAQASLALSREPSPASTARKPMRFHWGFIASTDTHKARPATGYKQYDRKEMTDARGFPTQSIDETITPRIRNLEADPREPQPANVPIRSFASLMDVEREASFMYPGGVVAVHADGRDRDSIWEAFLRREVYGTSGPRILLHFDLLNGPTGPAPMGSEVEMSATPRFRVRAAGAFRQEPGCPDWTRAGISPERLENLCRGECYNPGDERHPIEAIEVIRVRPQRFPDEPLAASIEDPWRRFTCPMDPAGCVVEFDDPEFAGSGRDTVYYVRALQAATPAINAATSRTTYDASGRAIASVPCYGNYQTDPNDDCLAPANERAWSSPIWIDRIGTGDVPAQASKGGPKTVPDRSDLERETPSMAVLQGR